MDASFCRRCFTLNYSPVWVSSLFCWVIIYMYCSRVCHNPSIWQLWREFWHYQLLSYLSAVGTFATVAVVSAVVLSTLVMFLTVGDNYAGNEREYQLYSSDGLPLALGFVAYCFSGHAIVPTIDIFVSECIYLFSIGLLTNASCHNSCVHTVYEHWWYKTTTTKHLRSMQRPQDFERMIDLKYTV